MKFQPYSIDHVPRSLPIWHQILGDLGDPDPRRVARVLGISLRTVQRYNRAGHAPKAVCLALFWVTRWGRSAVHCQAVADCQLAVGYAKALESANKQLKTQLAHVLAIGDFGAANEPMTGGDHARLR